MQRRNILKQRALDLGFDLVGVAPVAVWKDLEFSRRWVEKGYGGEMRYLENPKRDDPRLILPSVRSIVCVGLVYNAPLPYSTEVGRQEVGTVLATEHRGNPEDASARGWISRYAWGRDYHEIMRSKLEELRAAIEALAPGVETRVYVDTGPVVERAFARYSGIGWTGKNTCLINQEKGSWFFIGVVLTNLDLEPDLPAADRCGSCTRCIEACPTGALVEPYVMDASRCIAYLTIELKGSIPLEFRPAVGANVFGCDICQDVCPWNWSGGEQATGNQGTRDREEQGSGQPKAGASSQDSAAAGSERRFRPAATTDREEFQPLQVRPSAAEQAFSLFHPSLIELASITEDDFRRLFRGSPLKRAKYGGWLRNLCVAMGNSGNPRFVPWLERLLDQYDSLVSEHAEWAIERLRPRG